MDADEIALTFYVLDAVPIMSLVTSESSEGSEQGWGGGYTVPSNYSGTERAFLCSDQHGGEL